MVIAIRIIFLILALSCSRSVLAVIVEANLDTEEVSFGDSVELTYSVNEQSFGKKPDFSPLKQDFKILSSRQSSNISVLNGEKTATTTWRITLSPKRMGFVAIPPITYDSNASRALKLYVVKQRKIDQTNQHQNLFLDASVDKKEGYVQEQIIYTIRVFKGNVDLYDSSFSMPELDNTVMEQLGERRVYHSTVEGQRYEVIEFRYALFPQKSGELTIPAAEVLATVFTARSRGFGVNPFNGKQIRKSSQELTLNIKPKPKAYPSDQPWLPSESLTLTETWSPDSNQLKVGDPITRTITLEATGLTESSLPPVKMNSVGGIKSYPEPANTESHYNKRGVISKRTESLALIGTQSGDVTLPEVNVTWWDVKSEQVRIATLPARTLSLQSAQPATSETVKPNAPSQNTATKSTTELDFSQSDTDNSVFWQSLTVLSTLLWLGTLGFLLWSRKHLAPNNNTSSNTTPRRRFDIKPVLKQFRVACKNNDPKMARATLISLFQAHWDEPNLRTLDAISQRAQSATLPQAVNELDQYLYKNQQDRSWRSLALESSVMEILARKPKVDATQALQPLHPVG